MSDSDRPSRVSTAVAPATARPSADTVLATAAASPAAYSAATAQEAATALVRMLMEQMVLGPGAVEPETRADDPGSGPHGPDGCPPPRTGQDLPGEPPSARAPSFDNGKGRRR
ncbi:hypothetical protein ACFV2V_22625 [Streptomyces sp. NPDC059698]|uniref:hypothetical protein n=1 Tax=Streptomyces TaxID=1883 RepID=UPI0009393575|nr:hypothetical protein [Streptomyces sp. CB02366]OKJ31417.1 hypothetical protein AMK24_29080 [Streptomyces sp. CB02366]TVP36610.1 hypothetical protein A3L22_27890 [Streptomyces griseus subsp. griseus]WSS59614.1 hypothetical protein OG543_29760 [Streptomyces sp. NBC_01178]